MGRLKFLWTRFYLSILFGASYEREEFIYSIPSLYSLRVLCQICVNYSRIFYGLKYLHLSQWVGFTLTEILNVTTPMKSQTESQCMMDKSSSANKNRTSSVCFIHLRCYSRARHGKKRNRSWALTPQGCPFYSHPAYSFDMFRLLGQLQTACLFGLAPVLRWSVQHFFWLLCWSHTMRWSFQTSDTVRSWSQAVFICKTETTALQSFRTCLTIAT